MTEFRNISDTPEDLEGGRIVGIGETFTLSDEELSSSYNKAKISEGKFAEVVDPTKVEDAPPQPERSELLARAKQLDITGRSNMRNDELQTAIHHAESEQEGDDR